MLRPPFAKEFRDENKPAIPAERVFAPDAPSTTCRSRIARRGCSDPRWLRWQQQGRCGFHRRRPYSAPAAGLDHQRRDGLQSALLAARPDQSFERRRPQRSLAPPSELRHGLQILGRGATARQQWCGLCVDGCQRRVRDRRGQRQDHLEIRGQPHPKHEHGVLWLDESWRCDR